jgi:hypothetical protein
VLRELFDAGKQVTDALQDIVVHDDNFKNRITEAGGLI